MNFSGKLGNGQMNEWLNFGGDPDHGSGFRIATLVRRALAEVCTVPVLVVPPVTDRWPMISTFKRDLE